MSVLFASPWSSPHRTPKCHCFVLGDILLLHLQYDKVREQNIELFYIDYTPAELIIQLSFSDINRSGSDGLRLFVDPVRYCSAFAKLGR